MSSRSEIPALLTVKEVADLVRIKERKVYDLAAQGKIPCTRVTGKLLFPRDQIKAWLEADRSGPSWNGHSGMSAVPVVFLGSHDPLLEWSLRDSRCEIAALFDSSIDGLKRFFRGEGLATGLHLQDPQGEWNTSVVARDAHHSNSALVHWACRQRGLVMRKTTAMNADHLDWIRGHRLAMRQDGSGADIAFRKLLKSEGIELDPDRIRGPYRSEYDAVLAVRLGDADLAFGLQGLAQEFDLEFLPLVTERFDLLVDRGQWFAPPMQKLIDFTRGRKFSEHVRKMTGYDVRENGKVIWNA